MVPCNSTPPKKQRISVFSSFLPPPQSSYSTGSQATKPKMHIARTDRTTDLDILKYWVTQGNRNESSQRRNNLKRSNLYGAGCQIDKCCQVEKVHWLRCIPWQSPDMVWGRLPWMSDRGGGESFPVVTILWLEGVGWRDARIVVQ